MVNSSQHPGCVSYVTATDGVRLALEIANEAGDPTVLLAHGFGQTSGAWTATASALATQGCRCVSFDYRGHGESDRAPGGTYHFEQFTDDLVRVAQAQPQLPVLVGASMGGLLGLVSAAEASPSPYRALVLVDITPRWEASGVARIVAFMRAHPRGFADIAEAAEQIAAYLPQRRERKTAEQLAPLLRVETDGRLHWHWDPLLLDMVEESERYQPRLLAAAASVDLPVLLLSGSRSDVVSQATVKEFMHLAPHARHVELPHATHMVAGDANDAFTREIIRFVQSLDQPVAASVAGNFSS